MLPARRFGDAGRRTVITANARWLTLGSWKFIFPEHESLLQCERCCRGSADIVSFNGVRSCSARNAFRALAFHVATCHADLDFRVCGGMARGNGTPRVAASNIGSIHAGLLRTSLPVLDVCLSRWPAGIMLGIPRLECPRKCYAAQRHHTFIWPSSARVIHEKLFGWMKSEFHKTQDTIL